MFYHYFNTYHPKTIILNEQKESLKLMLHLKKKPCHVIFVNVEQHKTVKFKNLGAFAVLDAPTQATTLEEILYYSLDKNKKIS